MNEKGLKINKLFYTICLIVVLLLVQSCDNSKEDFAEIRKEILSGNVKTITVAAPGSWKYFDFEYDMWPGIKLAVEHINGKGGINGKKLNIIKYDDKCSVLEASKIARKIGDNPNVTAAFVCSFANTVISVASLYEYFGVLTVAPITNVLSSQLPYFDQYKLVFQSCPDTYWEAKKIIDTLKQKKLTRIIIYNIEDSEYGISLSDALDAYAYNEGFTIVDHKYYAG